MPALEPETGSDERSQGIPAKVPRLHVSADLPEGTCLRVSVAAFQYTAEKPPDLAPGGSGFPSGSLEPGLPEGRAPVVEAGEHPKFRPSSPEGEPAEEPGNGRELSQAGAAQTPAAERRAEWQETRIGRAAQLAFGRESEAFQPLKSWLQSIKKPAFAQSESGADIVQSLFTAAVVALAALPSILIIRDRWLEDPMVASRLDGLWCRVGFLCKTQFPHYFAAVFACCLALFLLILIKGGRYLRLCLPIKHHEIMKAELPAIHPLQAKTSRILLGFSGGCFMAGAVNSLGREPVPGWWFFLALSAYILGWLILEIHWEKVASALQRGWDAWVAFALAQVALIVFLAHAATAPSLNWIYLLGLALALANLLRYARRIPVILWIVSLALVLFSVGTNRWFFSVIGDDSGFYTYALQIAEGQTFSTTISHLFDGQAVYSAHPAFSSFLQAISLKFLGSDNFGWRFSSLSLSAISIGFFYLFYQKFVPGSTALLAACFLAASHYLMTFGKIGYNNLQALFAMSVMLWAAGWAISTHRRLAYIVLGLGMGLCFYVYPSALYALPLPLLLLLLYELPVTRITAGRWGLLILSLGIVLFPLLIQPGYWQSKLAGTLFNAPGLVASQSNVLFHFASNLLYAFFSFLYVPEESHFVVASYTDPLTAALILIGFSVAIGQVRRGKFNIFLLAGLGILLFLVGASHDRLTPSTTRMFMLLPWFALLAAFGLVWLTGQIRRAGVRIISRVILVMVVLVGVLSLNLYQAYVLSPRRSTRYQSVEMLYLRMIQRLQSFDPLSPLPLTFLFITDPDWGIDGFYLLNRIYAIPAAKADLHLLTLRESQLPEGDRELISRSSTLVILSPYMQDDWQTALIPSLNELGKEVCPIESLKGEQRFLLAASPEFRWLCYNQ